MKNYAFIFARGGSKGLPKKNLKNLSGKPLIQYSIETAQQSELISQVFVSTDDSEIAQVASKLGAIIIERPKDLAGDKSPEWLSWRHAIDWVRSQHGDFDNFVSLPCTSPLRSVDDVESAIQKKTDKGADICVSITSASRSPYFNMVKIDIEDRVKLVNEPDQAIERRQDAPEVYDLTTVVYVASPNFVLNQYGVFSGNTVSVIIPKERAVDIDDIYDFMLAEAIIEKGMNERSTRK